MSTFYDNYIAQCTKLNKSPSAVAEENGLSRTSPNGWKKGKLPRDTTLKKLADYFGCSVADLTGEIQEPTHEDVSGLSRSAFYASLDDMSTAELVELLAAATDKLNQKLKP